MDIFKQARIRLGLTQVQMATRLGLSTRTIASYEQGTRHVKVCELLTIAKAYSLTDNEIIMYLEHIAYAERRR